MIVFDCECDCFQELIDMEWSSCAHNPLHHSFNSDLSLEVVDFFEESLVGLCEISREVVQCLSNGRVGITFTKRVHLKGYPKKPDGASATIFISENTKVK